MKNKTGLLFSLLAITTFTFGQGSAVANQIVTKNISSAVHQAVAAAVAPVAAPAVAPAAALNKPTSPTDDTKVPHYFGPYPNWANSPQVLSNAIVAITGGGGKDALANAIVDPKTGGVTGYTITAPGTG